MKKLNIGIIGCGNIAGNYQKNRKLPITHIESYLSIRNTNIIAISDRDPVKLLKFKKKWKIKNAYLNYKKMIMDHNFDIISICTFSDSHYDIIKFCYKYEIKKIFCEKPFCNNKNQIRNILKITNNNFIISVNYFRRWNTELNILKKNILENKYGKIKNIEFHYTKDLLNNGTHLIDYCLYMFGKPISIKLLYSHKNKISFDFMFFYKKFHVKFTNIPDVNYTFIEGKIYFNDYLISFNERFQNYSIYKKISDNNYNNLNTLRKIKYIKTSWSLSITNAIKQLILAKNNRMINHSLNDSLLLRELYEKIIKL